MKNYRLNIIIVIILIGHCVNINVFAQESHFSQINKTPVITNPANAGVMDYEMRITNNYRNQWKSINIPYNTLHFGIDKKIRAFKQQFGISINVLNDLSQSNVIASNAFMFALSYARFFERHQFVGGIGLGTVFKNFDLHNLTFGSQFDPDLGTFDVSSASNENNLDQDLSYNDLSAGILWRSKVRDLEPLLGFSMYHLNRPDISFFNDDHPEHLSLKYTLHGNILIPVDSKYSLTPVFYYSYMGQSHEMISGAILGYRPGEFKLPIQKVYGSSFFRINPARNFDAMIIGGGIEFYNFDLGISYDFNVSSLRKVTNFQGAVEISLIFINGRPRKKGSSEPCYML